MIDVVSAYRHCERVTASEARNFSYGIRLLPPEKRRAMSAVYAFARRIDDVGDEAGAVADKKAALGELRAQAERPQDYADDPVLVAVADSARRFPLPLSAFVELVDGVELDVVMDSTGVSPYATFTELHQYCRFVAGSIGRLSVAVFGTRDDAAAQPLADALGVALQLTNILRDVGEDLRNGRVYLPAEDLARFGCDLRPDAAGRPLCPDLGPLSELVRFEGERAAQWYDDGLRLLPLLDRRSAACCAAMAGIYRRLLDRILTDPAGVLSRRVSLPTWEKAAVAVRSLARGAA